MRTEKLQTGQIVKVLCCSDDISLLRDSAASVHGHSSSVEQLEGAGQLYEGAGPGHPPQHPAQLYYPSPNVSRPASQLTEEEQVTPAAAVLEPNTLLCFQIKIAQRIGLIQHLPTGTFDGCKKNRE